MKLKEGRRGFSDTNFAHCFEKHRLISLLFKKKGYNRCTKIVNQCVKPSGLAPGSVCGGGTVTRSFFVTRGFNNIVFFLTSLSLVTSLITPFPGYGFLSNPAYII